eukprot:gene10206-21275_t
MNSSKIRHICYSFATHYRFLSSIHTIDSFTIKSNSLRHLLENTFRNIDTKVLKKRKKELELYLSSYNLDTSTEFNYDHINISNASTELKQINQDFNLIQSITDEYNESVELYELAKCENDLDVIKECNNNLDNINIKLNKYKISKLFTIENDEYDSYLDIVAGAGGLESCDWAYMLSQMYKSWSQLHNFTFETINEQKDEETTNGIRNATFKINGEKAYGWLKSEAGVHRLVRISPFDSHHRRHTSFALVRVYPSFPSNTTTVNNNDNINDKSTSHQSSKDQIRIAPNDIRVDTYRSSGAGGQHVNTTNSAIRITHKPSGIVVCCQQDRSQHRNKHIAMEMLQSKLLQLDLEQKKEQLFTSMLGLGENISFGNQIRTTVLHPYRLVKDHRTGWESNDVDGMLEGRLLQDAMAMTLEKKMIGL